MISKDFRSDTQEILKVGLPIVLGQLGIILVGFVDNMMVGHHSTLELAAASFVNNFMNLAFIFGLGFSFGLTPLISAAFTSGKVGQGLLLSNSLLANALVGVLLTIVMAILGYNLEWLGQPAELIAYIRPYYMLRAMSIVVVMLFDGYKQYADGTDRAMLAMKIILSSNVLNILLNYVLIFGRFGFPELGLLGAGIATLVALVYALIGMFIFLREDKSKWTLGFRYDAKTFVQLFRIGLPIGLQMGVEAASFSLAVVMVGWLGAAELAAHQIVAVISTLGFMIFYGVSSAVTIRMSRHYEERRVGRMRSIVWTGLVLQLMIATVFVSVLFVCRHYVARIFTDDEGLVAMVAVVCLPLMAYQIGDVLQILYSSALRGLRDVRFTAVSAVFCHVFLALGLVYLFAFTFGWGLVGVWMAFPVSLTTLGVVLYGRYRRVLKTLGEG